MNIYTLRASEKNGTGSIDVSLRLLNKWMEIEPGTEIHWNNRSFGLVEGGTPTDLIFAPGIQCVFSERLKECLDEFLTNIPVKWCKLRIIYKSVDYPYYFLTFCKKLTDIVCKEQSTIYDDFYFCTYFYPSKIMQYNIFYNPARENYQYIITDKVATELNKRKYSGICIDKNSVFLAKE